MTTPHAQLPPPANTFQARVLRAVWNRVWRAAFGVEPRALLARLDELRRIAEDRKVRLDELDAVCEAQRKALATADGRIAKLIEARTELQEKHRAVSERLTGFKTHIDNAAKRHDELAAKVALLERVLSTAGNNPRALWLFANRVERMDASLPLYDDARRAFHLARYHFAAARVAGLRVADIACGPGYGAAILRREGGAADVVGVDLDPETIAYAESAHGGDGVRFLCASGDATGLPDGGLDAVVSFETIEHVPDDQALIAEFARILAPGGQLIISTPNQWPLAVAPCHVREYDRAAFEAALAPHFEIGELFNQNSGTASKFNHGQEAGIVPTTAENQELAECYVAVCRRR